MTSPQSRKRILILTLVATAIAAPPAASAKLELNDPPQPTAGNTQLAAASIGPAQSSRASSSDFEWVDAGIGAAAAAGLMCAGGFAVVARRRGHGQRTS